MTYDDTEGWVQPGQVQFCADFRRGICTRNRRKFIHAQADGQLTSGNQSSWQTGYQSPDYGRSNRQESAPEATNWDPCWKAHAQAQAAKPQAQWRPVSATAPTGWDADHSWGPGQGGPRGNEQGPAHQTDAQHALAPSQQALLARAHQSAQGEIQLAAGQDPTQQAHQAQQAGQDPARPAHQPQQEQPHQPLQLPQTTLQAQASPGAGPTQSHEKQLPPGGHVPGPSGPLPASQEPSAEQRQQLAYDTYLETMRAIEAQKTQAVERLQGVQAEGLRAIQAASSNRGPTPGQKSSQVPYGDGLPSTAQPEGTPESTPPPPQPTQAHQGQQPTQGLESHQQRPAPEPAIQVAPQGAPQSEQPTIEQILHGGGSGPRPKARPLGAPAGPPQPPPASRPHLLPPAERVQAKNPPTAPPDAVQQTQTQTQLSQQDQQGQGAQQFIIHSGDTQEPTSPTPTTQPEGARTMELSGPPFSPLQLEVVALLQMGGAGRRPLDLRVQKG
jgi:hypothetical protein